ncbi:hypothetical protein Calag_0737 [Caldisphaera lagunensis DSM 15908]|uniref:Uncharacterized protein n=1 Tax=Caldisphaera lagunensis (strain DSM 15908 / JCM 11604 / ANMR 0165 / IC-154) TaxID=1056495 RepID=L0A9D2_CALLD|nr:hypothetical protein [Caldisphaera lagunensis]AFZ70481.1 hypothetical protein Calag_0737 [Caldisphaera lagunensis DSM 15908]
MGGRKQNKLKEEQVDQKASTTKDIKVVATQVITKDRVIQNPKLLSLLYLISQLGMVHERTLQIVVAELKNKGVDLGYQFSQLGNDPYSAALKNDIVALLYTGLAEAEPRYRKIRVTGDGKEVLEKADSIKPFQDSLNKILNEIKNKASMVDAEIDFEIRKVNKLSAKKIRK